MQAIHWSYYVEELRFDDREARHVVVRVANDLEIIIFGHGGVEDSISLRSSPRRMRYKPSIIASRVVRPSRVAGRVIARFSSGIDAIGIRLDVFVRISVESAFQSLQFAT